MSLKFRYATFLLLAFAVIGLFTYEIFQTVFQGRYPLAILLAALLYGTTFLLGKKLKKVFFTLSVIKFIKNANGVTSTSAIHTHLIRASGSDSTTADEILALLAKEKIVEIRGKSVLLRMTETTESSR